MMATSWVFRWCGQGLVKHSAGIYCLQLKGRCWSNQKPSMCQKRSFFHSEFRVAQYRPYPFFPLLQLWLAKILSNFFYNKTNGLLPLMSAPSSYSSGHPEQGGSNLLWNIRISLYYIGWNPPPQKKKWSSFQQQSLCKPGKLWTKFRITDPFFWLVL